MVTSPKPRHFPALGSVSTASGLTSHREGAVELGCHNAPSPASGRWKETCLEGSASAALCWRTGREALELPGVSRPHT